MNLFPTDFPFSFPTVALRTHWQALKWALLCAINSAYGSGRIDADVQKYIVIASSIPSCEQLREFHSWFASASCRSTPLCCFSETFEVDCKKIELDGRQRYSLFTSYATCIRQRRNGTKITLKNARALQTKFWNILFAITHIWYRHLTFPYFVKQ